MRTQKKPRQPNCNTRPTLGTPLADSLPPACGCTSALLALLLLVCAVSHGATRPGERIVLDGGWSVQAATSPGEQPAGDWTAIKTGQWPKQGRKDQHSFWYRRQLDLSAERRDSRILLDFHRLEGDAIVFLNGRRVGELLRPGGEFELTPAVAWGEENILDVFVTRDYTGISRGFEEDHLRYRVRGPQGRNLPMARWSMGITAPVELVLRPTPAAIAGVFVKPSWRNRELVVDVDIEVTRPVHGASLRLEVFDAAGQPVLQGAEDPIIVPPGKHVRTIRVPWANPVPWELDAPYLYTLNVHLREADGEVLDALSAQRFGFREIWIEGRDVYVNGNVSRWRIEWTSFGINEHSLSMLKLLGRNVVYRQNNPTAWWADWNETPYVDAGLKELLDEQGIGLILPAPSVSLVGDLLLRDKAVRADYQREMELWIRRHRNHPSILGWIVGMNAFNPRDAIFPATLGKRSDYNHIMGKVIEDAVGIVRENDPTRLAYSHADGNVGDVATANVYPNWAPPQEVSDWPERWTEQGDMPYFTVEYDCAYGGDFYKGARFLGTEFAAGLFGETAYRQETEELLRATVDIGVEGSRSHVGFGRSLANALSHFPLYWDIRNLYVTATDRAWRTWGVLGWHHWNFGISYGTPDGMGSTFNRYGWMTEPVSGRPEWANPHFDIYSASMQPLLAYIGGAPVFTDKTHAYFAGEQVAKQIVVVWDGPGPREFQAAWQARHGDRVVAENTLDIEARAGDILKIPVHFKAPEVAERTELILSMSLAENGKIVVEDSFALRVFPREVPQVATAHTAIWDPKGRTARWLRTLGVSAVSIEPGASLKNYDMLLVGREALEIGGMQPPWTPADIERGLNVVVFAQQPQVWEALGFLPDDLMTRRVFPNVSGHPVLAGLEADDLWDWRGSPDLLPAFERVYAHDGPRAPRSSNRGAVASVVLRVPEAVGFTPLLSAEFDLDYSPLLHFRDGRGAVWFCTLDFCDRIGADPVATRLAVNLLDAAGRPASPPTRARIVTPEAGDPRDAGFVLEPKSLYRAEVPEGPLFAGVGPRLMRWRDALDVDAFAAVGQPADSTVLADGLMLLHRAGDEERLYLRFSPDLLAERHPDDPRRRQAVQTSVWRLRQLTAQLKTNAGAEPDPAVAARIARLDPLPPYETLGSWHVLGPFFPTNPAPAAALDEEFQGESEAIVGDTNPNLIYNTGDGRRLDFRTIVNADPKGYVDLAGLEPKGENAVAYATYTVVSDGGRTANLRLGVDYFMKVWVNGEMVYRIDRGHSSPARNRHPVEVKLKAGQNVITLKVLSGSKGFGFWANISTADAVDPGVEDAGDQDGVSLYPPDIHAFDPYQYHYW